MRYLSGRAATLVHTFDNDETVLVPASVTVTVTPVGSAVAASTGSATVAVGVWSYTATGLALGVYDVKWDGGATALDVTQIEVVGAFLFTVKEARASDEDLTDAVKFPASEIQYYREMVEAEFEQITSRSPVPRVRLLKITADGSDNAVTGLHDVSAVLTVDTDAVVAGTWTVSAGSLLCAPDDLVEDQIYAVKIAYGMQTVPPDVKEAGLRRLRNLIVASHSAIPDRATGFNSADGGYFQLATAGRSGYETGIPDVDATYKRYRFDILNSTMAI